MLAKFMLSSVHVSTSGVCGWLNLSDVKDKLIQSRRATR